MLLTNKKMIMLYRPSRWLSGYRRLFYNISLRVKKRVCLTKVNNFICNTLYINNLQKHIINRWLNEKQPFFTHFVNPVNSFALFLPNFQHSPPPKSDNLPTGRQAFLRETSLRLCASAVKINSRNLQQNTTTIFSTN